MKQLESGGQTLARRRANSLTAGMLLDRPTDTASSLLSVEHLPRIKPTGAGNWSCDGRSIAFYRPDTDGITRLHVYDVERGTERQVTERPAFEEMNEGTDRRDVMGGPQWCPTADTVAFLSQRDGAPGVGVWIWDPSDGRPEEVMRHRADDRSVRWSPDGRQLAFVGNRDGRDNLFVGPIDGDPWQLTFDRFDNTDPDWSPDGRSIAFISQRSDADLFSNSICIVPAAGGEVKRLTHDDLANDRSPRWSPDGQTIAFVSDREDADDIWLLTPADGKIAKLTSGPGDKGDPQWSPDGTQIAYTHVTNATINIETVPIRGGHPNVIASGGASTCPRWSPDGRRLLYLHEDNTHPDDLWVATLVRSGEIERRQLTHADDGLSTVDFAPSSVVSFRSRDGLELQGLLYTPTRKSAELGPAIVWVRGGPNAVHVDGWHPLLQLLAQRGYTILAPNYRGSTGSGRSFRDANFGTTTGGDMDDWLGAADHLRGMSQIDPKRVAIMGRSYGGYAVLLALGLHPAEFQAGVSFCGPSDWFAYWENCEIGWGRRLHVKLMGIPILNRDAQALRSPATYALDYEAPVLILQGTADIGVPYSQATEMADLLRAAGKEHECVIYPGEGHVYTGPYAIQDSAARIIAFLHRSIGDSA